MGCTTSRNVNVVLSDEDVQFLTKNTRYTEKEIRDWYKGFVKECPSLKLTRDKFESIYKMFFSRGSPNNFVDHVFASFDRDNDGYIDFKEFLLAVGICTGDDPREKLKWTFRLYDINQDGFIDIQEMSKIIKSLYDMLGSSSPAHEQQKKVQFIFQRMDTNNDGQISLEEFIDVCTQDKQLAKLLCAGTGMPTSNDEEEENNNTDYAGY